jgi:hypothetical protein
MGSNSWTGDPPPPFCCNQPAWYSHPVLDYGPVLERIAAALERLAPAPADSDAAGNVEQQSEARQPE